MKAEKYSGKKGEKVREKLWSDIHSYTILQKVYIYFNKHQLKYQDQLP